MTFKISHKDKARIDSVALALRGQTGKLDDAVRIFNEQLDAARVALGSAVGEYNEELGAAKNLMEDVHRQMQAEFEARSEKWRDGDEAEPVRAWISELETIYLGLEAEAAPPQYVELELTELTGEGDDDHLALVERIRLSPND
jgi:hypothetical protein